MAGTNGLRCMNCDSNVLEPQEFQGVLVCSECKTSAEAMLQTGEATLHKLRVLLKEAIRIALVERKFSFDPAHQEDVSAVFKNVILLTEAANRRKKV